MRQLKATALAAITALSAWASTPTDSLYVKQLTFPSGASDEMKIDMASRLVPSPEQLAWQNLELTAFLHFGVNTFTDREWGDGKESPSVFNPTRLDADQWVKTLKDAGFRMVILTAKHHDGFCLWPTATTDHSVKSSEWRGGKGDVVADLRKACDKYGMKLGLYLSPWDRNASCYGNSDAYNDMFVNQLTELLGNYGRVDEVWFDGACGEGPNGKKQVYDWARFRSTIERLQPDAVMAIMGDDVRWVGNENGTGRLTEWSVTPKRPGILPDAEAYNEKYGLSDMATDLGSRKVVEAAPELHWWPSEVDVSVRPGWFYHPTEQPKSLRQLAEIYLNSVGRNSVLLLNVPPDREGRINAADSARLMELRRWIDASFGNDLVKKADYGKLVFDLRGKPTVNCIAVGEDIARGQRVERFEVQALEKGKWRTVARGTTIGYKRILTFPDVATRKLRLVIESSRGKANIKSFGAYRIEMPAEEQAEMAPNFYPAENFKTVSVDGREVAVETLAKAFDGDPRSWWESPHGEGNHEFVVDMGADVPVKAIVYTPQGDVAAPGQVFKYYVALSADGKNWNLFERSGEFSNVVNNPVPQTIRLPKTTTGRYVKFVCRGEADGLDYFRVPEFSVIIE